MPRPWGSEPYDVPLGTAPGVQAWAPPAGPPAAAPGHAWFAPTPVPAGAVPVPVSAPATGVHVPAWAPVPLPPPVATTPVHVWPPPGGHTLFAAEARPIVVHVPVRPKPRLVSGARWAEALSAALTVLVVAVVVLEIGRRAFVGFTGRPAGQGTVEALAVLLPLAVLALVGAWVTASVWLGRVLRTARDLDPDAAPYPLFFAWVCWLVPLFQLVLPVVLVRDAWLVGTRGRGRAVQPRVGAWWTAVLATGALAALAGVLTVTTGPGLEPWWLAVTTGALLMLVVALQAWFGVLDGVARALDRPRP
jgi:hypothetical protein